MAHQRCRSSTPFYKQLVDTLSYRVETTPDHSTTANVNYTEAILPVTRVARASDSVNHFPMMQVIRTGRGDVLSSEAPRPDGSFLIYCASKAADGPSGRRMQEFLDSGFPFWLTTNNLKRYTGSPTALALNTFRTYLREKIHL
jgi:hypothetical protein